MMDGGGRVPAPEVTYDDEERPARELTGVPERVVGGVALAVTLLALWQVFRPLPQAASST